MLGMLDRRAYFVRIEGLYSTGPTSGLAGRYDPSDGPQSIPSPGATNNAANGAIWIAKGRFQVAEDGNWNETMDTIRHETAHTMFDFAVDPDGYSIYGDAGAGSSMTAQHIAMMCK